MMKPEDAIKQLQFDMAMALFDPSTGEKRTPEMLKTHSEENYKTYMAEAVAISALEKQIPAKPQAGADFLVGHDDDGNAIWATDFVCPECGMGIAEEYVCCPYCGKTFNWR